MMLHSMNVNLDKPDTVFETLENIFRPESNQTLSRFKFRGLKQHQSQSCDAYMAELCLNIVKCKYPNTVQDELLKGSIHLWCLHKGGPGSPPRRENS